LRPSNVDYIEIMSKESNGLGRMSTAGNFKVLDRIVSATSAGSCMLYRRVGYQLILKIRGLMLSGQWGPWQEDIFPPGFVF